MLKSVAVVLLVVSTFAAGASAHGGGAVETMPDFGFTDLPPYAPKPSAPHKRLTHHKHKRWHQGSAPSN